MTFTIAFLISITAFILFKIKTISKRQNLKPNLEQRLVVSGVLLIIFIVTHAMLPYPESLYWFIVLGILAVISILSFEVIKKELQRFNRLSLKDRATNVVFYSLLVTVTSILI